MSKEGFKISFGELMFQLHFMLQYFDELTEETTVQELIIWLAEELEKANFFEKEVSELQKE